MQLCKSLSITLLCMHYTFRNYPCKVPFLSQSTCFCISKSQLTQRCQSSSGEEMHSWVAEYSNYSMVRAHISCQTIMDQSVKFCEISYHVFILENSFTKFSLQTGNPRNFISSKISWANCPFVPFLGFPAWQYKYT